MVLESLESETPNIKDLSIESIEEPTEFRFDVHKYLTPERLADILSTLENIKEADYDSTEYDEDHFDKARDYAIIASCLKVLMPEVFSQLGIDDSSFDYFSILKTYRSMSRDITWDLDPIVSLRLLFPERVKESEEYQDIKRNISLIMGLARPNNSLFYYAGLLKALNLELPPDTIKETDIQELVTYINTDLSCEYPLVFHEIYDLKIVSPDVSTQKLSLSYWKKIEEEYIQSKIFDNTISEYVLSNIFKMAVIAAQEVIIDDKGIKLQFPPEFEQANIPKIPETRNF